MSMPAGWSVLGLAGDPAPGDPGRVRALAERLHAEAKLAEDNTARLSGVSGDSSALRMRGDYAPKYAEALQVLPGELAKLGKAYRGAGDALRTYADGLERAKSLAGTALRQGGAADEQYQGALREVRAHLPGSAATGNLAEVESAVGAADPAVQASVRPAVQRARDADADRGRARRIADEAAQLRGDAESRAVTEIERALEGSGIQNRSWLEQAWDTVSTPFRSWDDFVNLARNVALVAGVALLVIGTGGVAGAILLGATVVAGAIVLGDSLNKYRQGKAGLGQVLMDGAALIPGGRQVGLLAQGAKAVAGLGAAAAAVRAGGGRVMGLGAFRTGALGPGATALRGGGAREAASIRSALESGGARSSTAASTAWQKGRQAFSDDPVHFPTGTVLLPQTDFELPGALPLALTRTHMSGYRAGRWFGASWASTFDQHLEIDDEGVCLATESGALLAFPHPGGDGPVLPETGPVLELRRDGDAYTVTEPGTGRSLRFEQDGEGYWPLSAITDRNGGRIDFRYAGGLLSEVIHHGGYHLDIETHEGLIVAVRLREAGQTIVSYGYDEHGDLTQVVNSSGVPLAFTYDALGRLTGWRDRAGTWYAYTYDDEGRCVRGVGPGGVFEIDIAYGDGVTTARDSFGQVTKYHYNELFQVIRVVDALGGETRQTWDRRDALLSRTDPLGRTTSHTYDPAGLPLTLTRPDGRRRRYTRGDREMTVTDFDGSVWRYEYDERGNLTADPERRYAYDEHGHLTTVTDALGQTHTITTNPAGLPIALTDPSGATTRYERDAFGRVTTMTDPLGDTVTHTWTVEGRPVTRTGPGGVTERWSYDAEGNQIGHEDALGQVTRTEYGPFDLPAARTTPDGARFAFAYDTELRLVAVTNPQGLVWRYAYDALGNLAEETDFDGRRLTYARDAAGQLVERVNGAGQSTRFARDALGLLVEQRSADRVTTFGYDPLGRLIRAVNPDAELLFERDAYGRVVAESRDGRTVTSEYDALGRRVVRRTPSGAESLWRHEARGRPAELRAAGQSLRFDYDAAGQEIARQVGDVRLTGEWEPGALLRSQTLTAGTRVVQRRTYRYRADGYPAEIDDLLAGRRRYDLDPAGRVTAVEGPGWREGYGYDAAGQPVTASWPGDGGARAYTGTRLRRAGRTRYAYDGQGRLVERHRDGLTWHYTWDADDRLTSLTTPDGRRWRYLYDALGRRVAKERDDGTGRVDFVWDALTLAEQTRDGRTTVWDWEPGAFRPIAQRERVRDAGQGWIDDRFYAIVTDLAGAPTELVDPDGTLAWRARSSLYGASPGAISAGADCPLRFPGQYADEESGLHYNHFRHYDPEIARYVSNDPLGLAGGWHPSGYVHNPLTWYDPLGLTPYVRNNPLRLDRFGESRKPLADRIEQVVDFFDMHGRPPAGTTQGQRQGFPVGEFANDRNRLPTRAEHYYTESDVWPLGTLPGGRGAERLVFGGKGEVYYTYNHYRSFLRLR